DFMMCHDITVGAQDHLTGGRVGELSCVAAYSHHFNFSCGVHTVINEPRCPEQQEQKHPANDPPLRPTCPAPPAGCLGTVFQRFIDSQTAQVWLHIVVSSEC